RTSRTLASFDRHHDGASSGPEPFEPDARGARAIDRLRPCPRRRPAGASTAAMPRLRAGAAAALLLAAGLPAFAAGGHFDVDDATVLEAGHSQIQIWSVK